MGPAGGAPADLPGRRLTPSAPLPALFFCPRLPAGMSQAMMRTRVLFQGATVGLMLATGGYQMLTMPKVLQKGRE